MSDLAARLASTPLQPGMPLWQLHLIEGYRGGHALLARIHHSIGDGMGLMRVLLSLTDDESAGADAEDGKRAARVGEDGGGFGGLARGLVRSSRWLSPGRLIERRRSFSIRFRGSVMRRAG